MLAILCEISLQIVICAGLGWLLTRARLLGPTKEILATFTWQECALIGYLGLAILGMLINFFAPVAPLPAQICAAVGIASFFVSLVDPGYRRLYNTRSMAMLIVITACVAFLTFFATLPSDATLYHIQAYLWVRDEPLAIGLANLHSRLGVSPIPAFAAAMMSLPWHQQTGEFVVNGTLSALMLSAFAERALRFRAMPLTALFCFATFLSLLIFTKILQLGLNNPSHDTPAGVLGMIAAAFTVIAYEAKLNNRAFLALRVAWLFAVAGFCTKGSTFSAMLFPLIGTLVAFRGAQSHRTRLILSIGTPAIFLLLIWSIRSFVMTGCLAFPAHSSCFYSLPWAVSDLMQLGESAKGITIWARAYVRGGSLQSLRDWSFFIPMLRGFCVWSNPLWVAMVTLIPTGLFLYLYGVWKNKHLSSQAHADLRYIILLYSATLLGFSWLIYYLPHPRFDYRLMLFFAIFPVFIGVVRANFQHRIMERTWLVTLMLIVALLRPVSTHVSNFQSSMLEARWPVLEGYSFPGQTQIDGFRVFIGTIGGLCWDYSVPCAPTIHAPGENFRMWRWAGRYYFEGRHKNPILRQRYLEEEKAREFPFERYWDL